MTVVLLSLAAFVSTVAGGLFALKFRHRLHFILAFTAGVLLGVVAFDILREIFAAARVETGDVRRAMTALVIGFLLFHVLEKFILLHHAHEADYAAHRHPSVGVVSAVALAGHSFMDGVAIGFAFQVSSTVGVAVAIAVIAHDFCDGINTVGLMLAHRNTDIRSIAMLLLDASAPVVGVACTLLFQVDPGFLVVYLGLFAGFLLYIGTADILPEAHSRAGPKAAVALTALTGLGAALIYFAARVVD